MGQAVRQARRVLRSDPRQARELGRARVESGTLNRERTSGQATIEAALTLPVVLIALLLVVQVGVVVRDALALVQAAGVGARAAAVTGRDHDAVDAVRGTAGPLDVDEIEITISPDESSRARGAPVTVELRYATRLRVPIVSAIASFELPLRSSSTMRIERDVQTPVPSPP